VDNPIILLTTKQVATALGISVQRVNQLARGRGLEIALVNGHRLFTESDLAALREPRPPGRPKSR
jgi:hypothetical protein